MVSTVGDVWGSPDVEQWQLALQRYDATIACQKPVALICCIEEGRREWNVIRVAGGRN